ncbi:ELMO domain-containing protein A [Cucurbita argyrosperma subsp. argyrosperma]|nr:ELMO domain-containing protein A [Cucurbita argyrosperma subsp. argyrosperma]
MSLVNTHRSCAPIRSLSPSSSSISRCAHTSSSDHVTCGTPTWIGKGITCICFKRKGTFERICINLTPEDRLRRLKQRMKVYFDGSRIDHQEALRALWYAAYPDQELQALVSDQWKEMGWQGRDPSTDFRSWIYLFGEFVVLCKDVLKNEWAFDLLYCVAFVVMDKQWLERNATYMEFNDVLKSTRAQLEKELLMEDVLRIEDMPSYNLLLTLDYR